MFGSDKDKAIRDAQEAARRNQDFNANQYKSHQVREAAQAAYNAAKNNKSR